jgi:hypothetical protein
MSRVRTAFPIPFRERPATHVSLKQLWNNHEGRGIGSKRKGDGVRLVSLLQQNDLIKGIFCFNMSYRDIKWRQGFS